jgi:hypothetical protein
MGQGACVYCGTPANGFDHFVPLSALVMLADSLTQIPGKVLVPACRECNLIAGRDVFPTIAAKRRFIHARLRRKYRRILAIPEWRDRELAELGPSLEKYVRSGQDTRRWLLARLAWRNTSNSEPATLAAIRSPFAVSGKGSAAKPANKPGTIASESAS